MKFYSTNHKSPEVNLEEAIFRGLPPDNGLYMPTEIKPLPNSFFEEIDKLNFQEIAFAVSQHLLGEDIEPKDLKQIVESAFDFDVPVKEILSNQHVLELWHGPSMAFKDFGARFMAGLMSHFLLKKKREIHILVATSGDTGGAVAQGFFNTEGIKVTILYPSGRVSPIQEKQLTTLGKNISAIEINGTFDDCQSLVKQAFLDKELTSKITLASANSINIARLIPQSFYYFKAYADLKKRGNKIVFSVPSGNFGNLSAGVWVWRLGLPIKRFIASTNVNDAVPNWLKINHFEPKTTIATISNAMDVGNPSNFIRLKTLSGDNWESRKNLLIGNSFSDKETNKAIQQVFEKTGYLMCPHTAVAWLGLNEFLKNQSENWDGVFLSTAHPAKFLETMENILEQPIDVPARLISLLEKPKIATRMSIDFDEFKNWLLLNK